MLDGGHPDGWPECTPGQVHGDHGYVSAAFVYDEAVFSCPFSVHPYACNSRGRGLI